MDSTRTWGSPQGDGRACRPPGRGAAGRRSQAGAPGPCSLHSGHGGPCTAPGGHLSRGHFCARQGASLPCRHHTVRPDARAPLRPSRVQHRSVLRHQPEIPGEGGLPCVQWRWPRSIPPLGLAQVVSGPGTEQTSRRVPPSRSWWCTERGLEEGRPAVQRRLWLECIDRVFTLQQYEYMG